MGKTTRTPDFIHTTIIAFLSLGLFVLDLQLPLGIANGVLYSIVVLIALRSSQKHFPLAVAGTSTLLTVLGAYLGPILTSVPLWISISNRIFSIFIIWVPIVFFSQHRRAQEALRAAYGELEIRVQERTKELADVNRALVEEISERIETEQSLRASEAAVEASREELQYNQQELRGLAARLLSAQDDERRRISRELHDDVNQRLAMLTVDLETLERSPSGSPESTGHGLRSIQDRLIELSDDVRRLAYQFHPSILDDLGLPIALQRLVDDFSARTGIKGTLTCPDRDCSWPQDVTSCLYRIAQESLTNVARHAHSSQVEVQLATVDHNAVLSVTDQGTGFDLNGDHHSQSSLGLVSMAERARLVNGELTVNSRPGHGTVVRVRVPLMKSGL
ncbi:MAG: histidine kinase [Nitrospiraceae bacterium]